MRSLLLHIHKHLSDLSHISLQSNGFAKILLMEKHVHVVSRQMMSLWPLLSLVLTFASAKLITSGYTGKHGYKMGGD